MQPGICMTPRFDVPTSTPAFELTLSDIQTDADAGDIVRGFVPTPRFAHVSFDSYRPDPRQPSQRDAADRLQGFVQEIHSDAEATGGFFRFFRRPTPKRGSRALYLDGGYGVGKTHLLAASYHEAPGPKAYFSFAELAYVIGHLGMQQALEAFSRYRLICIDEFELDDVANTRLAATFLRHIFEGTDPVTHVIATSNTLPTELGRGRIAAEDFLREIGQIASSFEVLTVEGNDFRQRPRWDVLGKGGGSVAGGGPAASGGSVLPGGHLPSPQALRHAYAEYVPVGKCKLYATFQELTERLSQLHPIRFARLLNPLERLFIEGLSPMEDQGMALRFVHFIDKVYDQQVRLSVSSTWELQDLFLPEYRDKGYKKKYQRCLSRLHEMLAESASEQAA